jgi:hypothetical protein
MSYSLIFTIAFAVALVAGLIVKFWLASRQVRHVAQHRGTVPAAFAQTITLAAHQKAADYTIAKARFGLIELAWSAALLLGWTLLGGLDVLNKLLLTWLGGGMVQQLVLLGAFALIGGLLELPFTLWQTFRLEERFGFNKMTWKLWLADTLKSTALGAVIGLPIAALDPLAHGRRRPVVVAVGLGCVDGLQPAADADLPELHRPAVQQVQAAGRPHAQDARHGVDEALRLRCQGAVRDGRQHAQRARQCLFHRLRRQQARGVLRHAAAPAQRPRGRGGSRARTGAFQAPPHREAAYRHVRAEPCRLRPARAGCRPRRGSTRAWVCSRT